MHIPLPLSHFIKKQLLQPHQSLQAKAKLASKHLIEAAKVLRTCSDGCYEHCHELGLAVVAYGFVISTDISELRVQREVQRSAAHGVAPPLSSAKAVASSLGKRAGPSTPSDGLLFSVKRMAPLQPNQVHPFTILSALGPIVEPLTTYPSIHTEVP